MYKIENEPTFPGSIKIVSLGREQTLEVTFRAKTRSQYQDLLTQKTGEEVFLELVEKWNVEAPLDKDGVAKVEEHQPGFVWAVIGHYGEALLAARKGN
jgi:hypothetical protein